MKKNILFVLIAVAIIGGAVGIYCLFLDNKSNNNIDDSQKFASEYTLVDEDNVFVYRNVDEIITVLKNGTGVVYLGFPECPWCQAYVKYLNDVAKEVGIEKVYYYNILEDRKNNTEEYQEIVSILSDYLQYDNEGNPRIYVPNVSFHINGKIIGNDYETSLDTHDLENPTDYWTNEEISNLKVILTTYMEQVYSANICTDCNK